MWSIPCDILQLSILNMQLIIFNLICKKEKLKRSSLVLTLDKRKCLLCSLVYSSTMQLLSDVASVSFISNKTLKIVIILTIKNS